MCNRENTFVDVRTETPTPPITTEENQTQTTTPLSGASDSNNPLTISISTAVGSVIVLLACVLSLAFRRCSNRRTEEIPDDSLGCNANLQIRIDGEKSMNDSLFPPIDFLSLNLKVKIGNGRFSQVWKASLHDYFVAVKIFPEKEKRSWKKEQEAYTDPKIRHDNLLRFLTAEPHVDRDETEYWMVLDYHELGSLTDYLIANVLTFEDVSKMTASVAAGLAYLHSEISGVKPAMAHRDVKSMNVLVKKDLTCCIGDLGLSIKFQSGTSLAEAHRQVSTCPLSICTDERETI